MNDKVIVSIASHLEMVGFIKSNGTACRFVSMLSHTPVVKIKAGNPFHKVSKGKVVGDCRLFKVSRKTGLINANYNTSVRNRIAEKLGVPLADVEYENGECYFEHLQTADGKNLPLIQHKDETKRASGLKLQYYPHKSTNCYVDENGNVIADELVKPWLYAESERPDFKPCVIGINVSNIKELRASGVIMQAEDVAEAETALASAN
jgi:hypothetical protein